MRGKGEAGGGGMGGRKEGPVIGKILPPSQSALDVKLGLAIRVFVLKVSSCCFKIHSVYVIRGGFFLRVGEGGGMGGLGSGLTRFLKVRGKRKENGEKKKKKK